MSICCRCSVSVSWFSPQLSLIKVSSLENPPSQRKCGEGGGIIKIKFNTDSYFIEETVNLVRHRSEELRY